MLASTVQFSKYGQETTVETTAYPHHPPEGRPGGPSGATATRNH